MAGELVTSDYEIEYRGALFGGDTAVALIQTEGLTAMPDVRGSNHRPVRRHGSIAAGRFLDQRVIRLLFEAEDISTNGDVIHEFEQAFTLTNSEEPLVLQIPNVARGRKVRLWGRVVRRNIPHDLEHYYGVPAPCLVEFESSDPRYYADTLQSVSGIRLEQPGDGLTWPLTWPLDWGAESAHDGTFTALNNGTFETPVTFTITGPVVNPRIENLTQDRTLSFNLEVGEGSTLVIDSKARTVLLDGIGDRYGFLTTSEWFNLAAGGDVIRFAADSGFGTLAAEWRSAWI